MPNKMKLSLYYRKIKQYKKKYFICKDDFGNKIYAGDTVELSCPQETSTTWTSIVHWNMLDGAFVDAHPAHKAMGLGSDNRTLSPLINQSDFIFYYEGNDEQFHEQGYCKKIKSFNE